MKKRIKLYEKFLSFFLDVMMIYSMVFTGIGVSAATDSAGNITTRSIILSNLTQAPIINATFNSYTPNPAKSSDEITVKYNINSDPFTLSSGMIDEAVVLVDMSQSMNSNQRFSQLQNGLVNQVINDSNLSKIKLGVVGYNDYVYIGSRENYPNEPKTCTVKKTDENLSNIDTTKFFPLYSLDNGNIKDGYRQFYQEDINIKNKISSNDQRKFGTALKVADKALTQFGAVNAKKAIVIISSGNLTYSDDEIENIRSKGYKIITLDISNSGSANIKDTHIKLCGNESGSLDNYYRGTFNDGVNYNSVDNDMKNVALSLEGKTSASTLSIKDAKLNIDLGENFEAVDDGGLDGSGKGRTVSIPQINFIKNSTTGLWEQSGPIEVTFKVKPVSGKYGELDFGLYANSDNSTYTNNSTISYTNFNSVLINKAIETPTITIRNIDTEPPILTLTPSTTNSTSGTVTITAAASDNVAVANIMTPDESIVQFNPATQNNSTTYIVSANGTYTFKATDTAGNITTKSIEITSINRTGLSNQGIINSTNTKRIAPSRVNLGETFDVNYTINFNDQTLDDSKPNRQQWLACVKDNSNNMNFEMVNDVQASSGSSRASIQNGINFKLNKNNIKCNESYYFSNDSSGSSLSSRMNDALTAVTQKNSQGHERDIVIMIGTNISDSELQNAIAVANNIKENSDNYKLGINSIVINIGNKTGEENIKKLAGALGGNYIFLNNADEVSKINDNYISQLAANIADNYPIKKIYFEDIFSDNFEVVNAPSFITIDNTNRKINGSFYANYYIQDGQIKCDAINFTVTYKAVSYKESSHIGTGVFKVVNNETDQKVLEKVPVQVVVPDTIPPTAPVITGPKDGTVTNNNTPTISGTAEANSTVKVYDGETLIGTVKADETGKWTLTPSIALEDGAHAITATATDAAGNVSEKSNMVNITVDTRAAAPVITAPADNTVTNDNTPTISGTAEANSTVNVYDGETLIGTVTADGTGNWILTLSTALADGAYAITAIATDVLGNVSPVSNTVNITIITRDTTAPEIPIISGNPPNSTDTNDKVTITIDYSSDSEIKQYRINGGVWQNYTGPFDVTENCTIEAQGIDKAENESGIASYTVDNIIKTVPDKPTITGSPSNDTATNGNVTITINYSNDSTTKEYRIIKGDSTGEWQTYSGTFEVRENCTIEAKGLNKFNTESEVASYTVSNIDKVAPNPPTISLNTEGKVTITPGSDNEGGSGVKEVKYQMYSGTSPADNQSWISYGEPFDVDLSVFTVKAKTIDNAGNESDAVTQTFYQYSSILKHGMYEINTTELIKSDITTFNVINTMSTELAMLVDVKTSNPTINLKISNVDNIENSIKVEQYLLLNGTISSLQKEATLSINNGSIYINNSEGFSMSKGQYLIIYTVTPKDSNKGSIELDPSIEGVTESKDNKITLKFEDLPDLF